MGGKPRDVLAVELYYSRRWWNAAANETDEGRLAGTVRSDDGSDLSRGKLEVDALYGAEPAE